MRTFPSGPVSSIRYAVPLAAAVVILSACGSAEGPGGSSPEATTAPPLPTAASSGPAASPSTPGSGRARPSTMTGRVTSIEGGCVLFTDDRTTKQYVLVGETKDLSAGTAYTVEGVTIDTPEANCPQALPFQVRKATMTDYRGELKPSITTGPAAKPVTLRGAVEAGVEGDCRVLRSDQGTFVLVGSVEVPNGRVVVTGVRRDDVATTCQQGPAFEVTAARRDA